MIDRIKEYCQLSDVREISLEEYVSEREILFARILKRAISQRLISEAAYEQLMCQVVEERTWDEAFRRLEELFMELLDTMRNHLLERMVKGAEMIENESNPEKKATYLKHYGQLENQFNQLKGGFQT